MAVVSKGNSPLIVDLKSATLTLVAVVLKPTDLAEMGHELGERFGGSGDFFSQDPVVIDLTAVQDAPRGLDFPALLGLLRRHHMAPVAAKGGNPAQMAAALAAGLFEAPDTPAPKAAARAEPIIKEVVREVQVEVVREVEVPGGATTLIVDKPLRSGQQVYAKGGDLVVLAAVNNGAE